MFNKKQIQNLEFRISDLELQYSLLIAAYNEISERLECEKMESAKWKAACLRQVEKAQEN